MNNNANKFGAGLWPLLVFSLWPSMSLLAHQYTVRAGESVAAAIDRAAAGDTVLVYKGHYRVHQLTIRKPLSLLGVGRPVLDGGGRGNILLVAADCVHIRGFVIRDTGVAQMDDPAGIKFFDATHCIVEDNELEHTFFGIHFSNSSYNRVRNNKLKTNALKEFQTGNGIHLWKCHHNEIEGNYVEGHRDGIYLEFVTQTQCKDNVVVGNKRYGLHFMFSHENAYLRNIFRSNGAGVAVMYTRRVHMEDNLFQANQGASAYGLLLKDITDSKIVGNRFVANTTGIYMEGSNRNVLTGNLFNRNGAAVKLMASCDNNEFRYNDFVANTFDVTTNGSVVLNQLAQNYWDKYEGYDLDGNGYGDVPYRPISLYSIIIERIPPAVVLLRSLLVSLLDRAERVLPAISPENMKDEQPKMRKYDRYSQTEQALWESAGTAGL